MALSPVSGASEVEQAQGYTRRLAHSHYENFSVVSLMLPRELRQDFCNVYAFCRIADDMADELGDPVRASQCLAELRRQTEECYAGHVSTRLFAALSATIEKYDVPAQPFLDLIDAFEQDQRVDRYQSFGEVVDYCRRSADPVGRLVLYMCGYRDAERQRLSDRICTALQLTNFWQDVRRDMLDRNRIYIPRESMDKFGVTEEQIHQGRFDERFAQLMRWEVDRTQRMFDEGRQLLPMLHWQVRKHIALFGKGGEAILDAIRHQNFDTLTSRPSLSRWQKTRLMITALGAGLAGKLYKRAAA
jgi:squalene synthase HpnC